MRYVHSFSSWLSGFLYQVTALPPSPCLVWISRHAPCPSFESLTPELRLVFASPPSCIFGAKVLDLLCSSVCRLHCTDHPNASKIALGNLGSVGRSGFSLPISAPRRLRWGWLYFPAALTMKEFSIFLGLLLASDDDVSVVPAFMVVLPGPSSVSRVTLSITPCLLCWRRSLSPWCWRRVLGGSTSPSCSITWGSCSVGPSKPSTWVFVVPAFGPGFHLGRSPGHTCPSRTLAWRLTPLSFLRPFIGARWYPSSKGWYSPLVFPFSPPGGFGWHCSAIQFRYMVSLPLYLLDLLLTFAPSTFLPGLG